MQIGEEAPTAQPDLRPGQIVIKDLDGYVRDENGNPKVDENGRFMLLGRPDGIIDEADTELIGTLDPGWMASMTNTFKYKGFDLNIMFNGMFDRIMQDPTEMDFGVNGGGIAQSGYNMLRTSKTDGPSTIRRPHVPALTTSPELTIRQETSSTRKPGSSVCRTSAWDIHCPSLYWQKLRC